MLLTARDVFDRDMLKKICEMHEDDFADEFGFEITNVPQSVPNDFYLFKDNGARVLAVAHLDTVGRHEDRTASFVQTADGEVVFSRALDDRLGAYIILDMLPKLGIEVDILLTVGEECGMSTAEFFEPADGKQYDWMIEFDRGGTDVVLYQYDDPTSRALVRDCGARVGEGIFSDICYLEHLEIKGFNWGVGYEDYHGPRAHAFLRDTFKMVDFFVDFYAMNVGEWMPHDPTPSYSLGRPSNRGSAIRGWSAEEWDEYDRMEAEEADRERMSILARMAFEDGEAGRRQRSRSHGSEDDDPTSPFHWSDSAYDWDDETSNNPTTFYGSRVG